MDRSTPEDHASAGSAEVVDFEAALLDACPPDELAELLGEAELLARAFAPSADARRLEALAGELKSGVRHLGRGRRHALRLAAALRRLAQTAED
jgi:hypothetical protein